jgi:predicted ATP-grasp superfamily ATP-dependent carboligase
LIERLVTLGSRLACRPVLILTSDQSVECVSAHREQIEPLFRISLPSAEIVRALSDKILFQSLAEHEGFGVPRAVAVTDATDLSLLRTLVPPLILKPANKKLVLDGVVDRAVRAGTVAEAQSAAARMRMCAPRLIVQEWIDGGDDEIFFTLFSCDRQGRVVGLFPGRKLVCSPPAVGNTAVCVAAPEMAEQLAARTLEFIGRVGYRGLGSLEFKRDSATGRLLIVEPTVGRTDWQEEIATLCGVNLPLLTYCAELGHPIPRHEAALATCAWRSSRRHSPPPGSLGPGTRLIDGFFRWSDPLPAVYHYGYERCVFRLWRHVTRRLSFQPMSACKGEG